MLLVPHTALNCQAVQAVGEYLYGSRMPKEHVFSQTQLQQTDEYADNRLTARSLRRNWKQGDGECACCNEE